MSTEEAAAPQPDPRKSSVLLPVGGAFFFAYMLFLFLACRPLLLLGDGGTARHIVTGQWIFEHLAIPKTNYVFALNPDAPWTTHELLADLFLAGANQLFGLNGVVLLSASVICLILTWTYQFARAGGIGTISGLFSLIVIMSATSIHWSARAHLFSYVPFLLIYYLVYINQSKSPLKYLTIGLIMALWANLHGSFILGLLIIVLKLLADGLTNVFQAKANIENDSVGQIGLNAPTPTSWQTNAIMLLSAILGASLNVRGFNFFAYVVSYATNPLIRFHSEESRSIDFMVGMPVFAFLILFYLTVFVWASARKAPRLADILLVLTFFTGGLYAMRIIPYFALIVLPSMAQSWLALREEYLADSEGAPQKNALKNVLIKTLTAEKRLDQNEATNFRSVWKVYALTLAFVIGWLALPLSKVQDFDPERIPVNAMEHLRKEFPGEGKPKGLGFNPDNWGDYLYLKTREPVFIDDKGDFYDASFTNKYITLFSGGEGVRDLLNEFKLNWILAPNALPMVALLKDDPAWRVDYKDDLVTILIRQAPPAESGKK